LVVFRSLIGVSMRDTNEQRVVEDSPVSRPLPSWRDTVSSVLLILEEAISHAEQAIACEETSDTQEKEYTDVSEKAATLANLSETLRKKKEEALAELNTYLEEEAIAANIPVEQYLRIAHHLPKEEEARLG